LGLLVCWGGEQMGANAVLPDLPAGFSRDQGVAGTTPASRPVRGSYGPKSAPPDLLAFVQAHRPVQAARELGLSERTVSRLAAGYWPADARTVVAAWSAYCGRTAARKTRWFLRRVHPGGIVRHSPLAYTGQGLEGRIGQLVAVARAEGGALVAQTLELPITRLALSVALQEAA
jgi:hypothetical protein